MPLRIDNLPAEEIAAALAVDPDELPKREGLAIKDFIERIGGRENAIKAVKLLEQLEAGDVR